MSRSRRQPTPPSLGRRHRHALHASRSAAIETLEERRVLSADYLQFALVSDQANQALVQDANLVNPWGIGIAPSSGDFWIADNAKNVATLYGGDFGGSPLTPSSLVVGVPGGAPTAAAFNIFNGANEFNVSSGAFSGPASFLFAGQSGGVSGWNTNVPGPSPSTAAQLAASVSGANFTGLAQASSGGQDLLYAADFHNGAIDVFNSSFQRVALSGSFTDSNLPAGYAPFNIQNLNGSLFVTYAKQDGAGQHPVAGAGNGFVDIFDPGGNLMNRLIVGQPGSAGSPLNAPWGLALAPNSGFGDLSGDLLVANSGDGHINAFNQVNGTFLGTVLDANGSALTVDGLHAIMFGNGASSGEPNVLFFTAGTNNQQHGLFGSLESADLASLDSVGRTFTIGANLPFSGAVATFSDANLAAATGSFTPTINWGDGGSSRGTVTSLAAGRFIVSGSHAYSAAGTYSVTVSINDSQSHSTTANSVAQVPTTAALALQVNNLTLTESAGFSGTVASFADGDGNTNSTIYSATIRWGDGDATPGNIVSAAGHFNITGSHTYAEEGQYPLGVLVDDADGATASVSAVATVNDAALSVAGTTLGTTEGTTFSGTVATLIDGNIHATTADFTATIDWGDNSSTNAVVSPNGRGGFSITGQHAYAEGGTYHATVQVNDVGGASGAAISQFNVADFPLTGSPATLTGREGSNFSGQVATFVDADPDGGSVSEYTTSIDWGDGATTSGSVSGAAGHYTITGSHIFMDEASGVTVTVRDAGGASATIHSPADIADADVLVGTGTTLSAVEGQNVSGTVGTFHDIYTANTADDFSAQVVWGDGQTSSGNVTGSSGDYTVSGAHVYADEGTYTAHVTLSDDAPGTAKATVSTTVTAVDAPLVANTFGFSPIEGSTFTGAVASFTDGNPLATVADFTATIDWGDSTTSTGQFVAVGGGTFHVIGTHAFGEEGQTSNVRVAVQDIGGSSVTATSTGLVVDAPLTVSAVAISGHEQLALSGITVATFTDAGPLDALADYSATIDWGDGVTTTGAISLNGQTFTVSGSHTYADEGHYTLRITAAEAAGSAFTGQATATIAEQLLADGTAGTPAERWVNEVYHDLLGRQADPGGLAFWGAQAASPSSRESAISQIQNSDEYRLDIVKSLFDHYLRRAPDPGAAAFFVAALGAGQTEERVAETLTGSPEYFTAEGGGTNSGFLDALFHDALGRPVDAGAAQFFSQALAAGAGRAQVAAAVFSSSEYLDDVVSGIYQQLLERPADASGLAYWAGQLAHGAHDEQITAAIAASDEYFNKTAF
jgi:uncharacterized protein (TIGR03118 family)